MLIKKKKILLSDIAQERRKKQYNDISPAAKMTEVG